MNHKYTSEQNDFLISIYPNNNNHEVQKLFNIRFGTNLSELAIFSHCKKSLKLYKNKKHFTNEMKLWVKKNYPKNESRKQTYARFVSLFGSDILTYSSFVSYCKKHKINKPKQRWNYQNGNKTWSTGLSKSEHKKHFTEQSFSNMISTSRNNFPHIRDRLIRNITDTDTVLSDLGNGQKILIPHNIYKRMTWREVIRKGELTLTFLDIYKVKVMLEDLKNGNNPNDNDM